MAREDTATAANTPTHPGVTMPMPSRRGLKRARGASPEDDEAGLARGSPRRAAGIDDDFVQMEEASMDEIGENDGEEVEDVKAAKQLIDYLGAGKDDDDGDVKAGSSAADDHLSDRPASPEDESFLVLPDDAIITDGSAATAGDDAPDRRSGVLGFDLNQQPCSSDESDAPENAADSSAATAEDGSIEFVDGATVPPASAGFGFDLNQPCLSEFMDGAAADPSHVTDPIPAPAEDGLAERPELPDGGAPAVSRTRRRRRLWDWAFEWTNVLGLGPFGWKRSRR